MKTSFGSKILIPSKASITLLKSMIIYKPGKKKNQLLLVAKISFILIIIVSRTYFNSSKDTDHIYVYSKVFGSTE